MTESDRTHFLFLARKLRERAKKALGTAETFSDPEARRMMFAIAERYQKLAARLESWRPRTSDKKDAPDTMSGGYHGAPEPPRKGESSPDSEG
jgi:hypothetical protein